MPLKHLQPIENQLVSKEYKMQQIGFQIQKNSYQYGLPDLFDVKVAFFCLETEDENMLLFRKNFYSLYIGNWSFSIADLGNLFVSGSESDTYQKVQEIVSYLIKKGIAPVVIGGKNELPYHLYRSFDQLEQMVNLVSVSASFDLGNENELFSKNATWNRIFGESPINLLSFSNLGYQSYLVAQEELDFIDKMCFDAYRLGSVTNDLTIAEPAMRDADIVSIDFKSVQSADLGILNGNVNGFSNREICTISRYAGISPNVSVLGIFNVEQTNLSCQLLAQMCWYFCEGFNFKEKELPMIEDENYTKYIVIIDDLNVEFFESNATKRWWMKPGSDKFCKPDNHLPLGLIPCLPSDYEEAMKGNIPERWWKSYRKAMI